MDSDTDVPISGRSIDNHTGMNPQRPIVTMVPESNSARNFYIFNSIKGALDISFRGLPWHIAAKSESENIGGNNIFENAERENNFEVEKVGHKNSVI